MEEVVKKWPLFKKEKKRRGKTCVQHTETNRIFAFKLLASQIRCELYCVYKF